MNKNIKSNTNLGYNNDGNYIPMPSYTEDDSSIKHNNESVGKITHDTKVSLANITDRLFSRF